jgi:hypothetical protein
MKTTPTLPRLRSFTLKHEPVHRQDEIDQLCAWVNQVVASSCLESLHLSHNGEVARRIEINDFISALVRQHATTLRFLYLDSLHIGNARQILCEGFLNMEKLSIVDYGSDLVRMHIVHSQLYSFLTITAFTVDFHGTRFKDEEAPHCFLQQPR